MPALTRVRTSGPAAVHGTPPAGAAADRRRPSSAGPPRPERRALGNQGTQYLIQAKLRVGAPDDRFEREADGVAEQVMRMPLPAAAGTAGAPALALALANGGITRRVQRQSVEEDEDLTLQAKATNRAAAPQGQRTQRLVTSLQNGGHPLPATQRAFFEPRFGVDFSGVRIHRDSRAAQAAHGLGARAYTLGRNVVFGSGEYRPGTEPGRRLIAHELAHVVQQGASGSAPASVVQRQQPTAAELRQRLRSRQAELDRLRPIAERLRAQTDPAEARARRQAERRPIPTGFVADAAIPVMQRVITVLHGGATIRLRANMEITFLGQTPAQGRARAQALIPQLVSTIRNAWTVDMTDGPYFGHTFVLEPVIAYRPPTTQGRNNAWQIVVRETGGGPTATTWWNGLIDMNPNHLVGNRIIVIAHEIFHLFGAPDFHIRGSRGDVAARPDPANRADLLGLVDPLVLQGRLREGRISQAVFDQQTGSAPRVWVEDATNILQALGIRPAQNADLRQAAQDLDHQSVEQFESPFSRRRAELDLIGQRRRLAEIRARQARTEANIRWLETVDRILQLEAEIARLERQLGQPTAPRGRP